MQHALQSLQARVGVAVNQVYALRKPEIDVLDEAGEYPLLAAEMAIYRALADSYHASEIADCQRLHAVFGYQKPGGVNDFASSYAGGAARPYNHLN